ncbi:MAG: hypothetical protein JO149_00780, partial [Gammaproteobacteria bacterium]|nr:hypothetical protein [Gammaproteobacteria bacterium]
VIPSQLRAVVPAGKNNYRQTVFIQDETGCKEINSYFHCASVAHVTHGDELIATDITKENLLQQKLISGTDASIMICLNSSSGDTFTGAYEKYYQREYAPDDSLIIKLTENAAAQLKEQYIYAAKICLNGYRHIEYNHYEGINQLINLIKANLKMVTQDDIIKKLHGYIKKINGLQSQINIYDILDKEVKGLDIIYCLTKIISLNNQLAARYPEKNLKTAAVRFGCASGENRTGITYLDITGQSIITYFEEEKKRPLTNQEKTQIYNWIADSQHIHITTGNQGNTFGTEGIRGKSSASFKPLHPWKKLITKTADLKKLAPQDFSFNLALDNLEQCLLFMRKNKSLQALLHSANQLMLNIKKLITEIVLMADEDKKMCQESLIMATHLLNKPCTSVLSDLNMLILKINQKIASLQIKCPAWLKEVNDLLTQLSTAADQFLKLTTSHTAKSIFQPINQDEMLVQQAMQNTVYENQLQY